MKTERRQYPRAEITWPVTIRTPQGPMLAQTRNLSASGAFIHCEQPLELSQIVIILVDPPNRSSLRIIAEVRSRGKGVALGIGVRFVEISDEDSQFLSEVVLNHLESKGIDWREEGEEE